MPLHNEENELLVFKYICHETYYYRVTSFAWFLDRLSEIDIANLWYILCTLAPTFATHTRSRNPYRRYGATCEIILLGGRIWEKSNDTRSKERRERRACTYEYAMRIINRNCIAFQLPGYYLGEGAFTFRQPYFMKQNRTAMPRDSPCKMRAESRAHLELESRRAGYLSLVSVKRTCLLTLGSYLRNCSFWGNVRGFLRFT